jgi:hypothetical protein
MPAPPLSDEQIRLRRALKSTVARFDDEDEQQVGKRKRTPDDAASR